MFTLVSLLSIIGQSSGLIGLLTLIAIGMMLVKSGHRFPWNETPEGKFWTTPTPERWTVGDEHNQVCGPDIASAATIAPTHSVHIVSGTAAIVNITPPWATFSGSIVLIATGIWTWTAAGNIAVLGTVTAAQKSVRFTYHPGTQKWYPGSVA